MADTLSPEIQKRIDYWLKGPFDEKTKREIQTLQEKNPHSLIDAFFSDLSFGTGGMRGIMGPGTNRMNIYTIRLATQGLANYLRKTQQNPLSVVIGYDSRNHSQEFAQEAARVLAGNQIHVYLLDELRPTPYISFACRLKKASAAINITASHNPKEYNGYKVYWSDGAQVVFPHDEGIVKEAEALKDLSAVHLSPLNDPLIERVATAQLDREYLKAIAPLQHFSQENHREGPSLKIVYTPLHGTGFTIVPLALKDWGFTHLQLVSEQSKPNGDFPTVKFPNPEYKETLQLGIADLERTESDLLLATDPDADRIGIAIRDQGKTILFNGNEVAALCVDYLCEVLTKLKKIPSKGAFVTTIVTTELLKTIALAHAQKCFEVLTGFKYIGEKIRLWETSPNGYQFIFGAEESYGYLLGTHARDKDAIISSCLIAEMALYAKLHGQTLRDRLHAIYKKYGIFREKQMSLNFNPGKEGMDQMATLMQRLRSNPPRTIASHKVISIEDYEKKICTDLNTHQTKPLDLPQSDVLLFRLDDQSRLVIRPSGTEPKIKIYGSVTSKHFAAIESGIQECDQRLDQLLDALKKDTQ